MPPISPTPHPFSLGYRCLKECFAADDFKMRNPGPSACIAFLDRCKELYADKAKDALAIADDIRTKHLHSEVRRVAPLAAPVLDAVGRRSLLVHRRQRLLRGSC